MSRRSRAAAAAAQTGSFDALETGRLTWMGLTVAGVGWMLLIGETTIVDVLTAKLAHPMTPAFHIDFRDIAKCVIASGFALAIIGALQTGFGALNRFFEAVLMRSNQRGAPIERTGPTHIEPEMAPAPQKRPYRILADGSVEVETIVGTRRFDTLDEAREFI